MTFTSENRQDPLGFEASFRREQLARDRGVATVLLLLAFVFHVLSIPTDPKILGGSEFLFIVWGIRIVSAAMALVALILIRCRRDAAFFDNIMFAWAALLMMGIAAANAMFPSDYVVHVAWDLLLAFSAYSVLPLSLWRQMVTASIITASDIILFFYFKELSRPVAALDVSIALVCTNVIGVFLSWELRRWKQAQFKARLETKTLKGIIPICSCCKKVRTEDGDWTQVEAYIKGHADADFTHGYCPDCFEKMMDEADREEKSEG